MNEFDETVEKLESKLDLSAGFFNNLSKEDDWSFVIKCHALMESACSYLLTSYFDNSNYADIISRLEMSDNRKGKLAFLRAAGLVIPEEATFIIGLSELRNKLVHNIHCVTFQFSKYVLSLDKNKKQSFANRIGYANLEPDDNDKLILKDRGSILSDPKAAILQGLKIILAIIMMQIETKSYKLKIKDQQIEIYKSAIEYTRLLREVETTNSQ